MALVHNENSVADSLARQGAHEGELWTFPCNNHELPVSAISTTDSVPDFQALQKKVAMLSEGIKQVQAGKKLPQQSPLKPYKPNLNLKENFLLMF